MKGLFKGDRHCHELWITVAALGVYGLLKLEPTHGRSAVAVFILNPSRLGLELWQCRWCA